ncbi:hypothetical protein ACEWY4_001751 [Coilia grayii]|uniref:NAD(P)(+)--arginine ADP-ribosyltransferase n=1 Tax=Coilia grayii TaxID=363190 RepID=A0ABD1KTU3_9TELE
MNPADGAWPALFLQDERGRGEELSLDMAEDSVDDRYHGCTKKMADLVEHTFLIRELNASTVFSVAWKDEDMKGLCEEDIYGLTKNHCIALRVYTSVKENRHRSLASGINDVYESFNTAVRQGKKRYRSREYEWYSLQFYLTDALQILNRENECKATYRGTKLRLDKNVLNKKIRLGSFVSSSIKKYKAKMFGTNSCFTIHTCHGASMVKLSLYDDMDEVLIPPYEEFKVTAIVNSSWCDTVYVLNSTGTRSDLNCVHVLTDRWYIILIGCLMPVVVFVLVGVFCYRRSIREG